jgi:hypothetical protein
VEDHEAADLAGCLHLRRADPLRPLLPAVRIVLLRAGTAMFFASGLLALIPSIAYRICDSPVGCGMLLGCVGFGAVKQRNRSFSYQPSDCKSNARKTDAASTPAQLCRRSNL